MNGNRGHRPARATALTMGGVPRIVIALVALVPLWLVVLWSLA